MSPWSVLARQRRKRGGMYSISNTPTHTCYHNDTASVSKPHHLLCCCLCSHETTCHVHTHHSVRILRSVLQSRGLLLNTSGCNQSIESLVVSGNFLNNGVHPLDVSNIKSPIRKRAAEFFLCPLLDTEEICRGGFKTIECIDC
jgi:hypothetical protein